MALSRTEIKALSADGVLLCPGRYIRDLAALEYAGAAEAAGHSVWHTPRILTWLAWLTGIFEECATRGRAATPETVAGNRLLLSAAHERALWRAIVQQQSTDEMALQWHALAAQAQSAWRLLRHWDIPPASLRSHAVTADTEAFLDWAAAFEERLDGAGWLDSASLPGWLLAHAPACFAGQRVLTRGFCCPFPQQRRVLAACAALGSTAALAEPSPGALPAIVQACADERLEARTAVTWALARLAQAPQSRVAILCPDPGRDVERVREALDLEAGAAHVFDAAGSAAAGHPSIAAALDILSLALRGNDWRLVSSLLCGGWPTPEQSGARAVLDAELRSRGQVDLALRDLLRSARRARVGETFVNVLAQHLGIVEQAPRRRSAAEWIADFNRLLQIWQWHPQGEPMQRTRLRALWDESLASVQGLDLVVPPMTRGEALSALREALRTARLPRGTAEARLHVVPLEDAADMHADAVWIVGMHELAWPPARKPHPLIPIGVQRRHGMPQADLQAALREAHARVQAAMAGAGTCIVSWARRVGDTELGPSPWIQCCAPAGLALPDSLPRAWRAVTMSADTETISDACAPALPPGVSMTGGTALLDDQSACPFRGVTRHRMRLETLDEPSPGLNAAARGQLLHTAMQSCWSTLHDLRALQALSDEARRELCSQAAAHALGAYERRNALRLPRRFRALEAERLAALVDAALELDTGRAAFAVDALEQKSTVQIGGLSLTARMDRVDRLDGERVLVIDYKTGRSSAADWLGDRPRACQLPFYAIARRDVAGIAFAQLRADKAHYVGLADRAIDGTGIKAGDTDWPTQCDDWRRRLTLLAEEFRDGHAAVAPQAWACAFCELPGLCRIAEHDVRK